MIREWEEEEQAFQYEVTDGAARLLQWKGRALAAVVPQEINGMPVTAIGRKAFLSNKKVQEVYLPESIAEIDDWAFAYCSSLVSVRAPRRNIAFGKGVFFECGKLDRLLVYAQENVEADNGANEETARLLAAVVYKLDAPYLLDLMEAGSAQWIEKWDAKLLQILHTPDREGFSKTLLCGEEDYGSKENNLDYFMSQKRRGKVRLALLRLLSDRELPENIRHILTNYLKEHTKGCAKEETWQVVKEEYGTEKRYYDLLLETGALTEKNFDAVLCDMGCELAEMKAYLLQKKEERFGSGSFFDSLSLEL